jgi:hypothetical protein
MTIATSAPAPRRSKRLLIAAAIAIGAAGFAAANIHLVYVAITSQPDCVSHSRAPGETGQAAKSAC